MTRVHSGQRGPFKQDFGMIRLESSGSNCSMGASFWGKGVNPSYTRVRILCFFPNSGNCNTADSPPDSSPGDRRENKCSACGAMQ